MTDTDAITATIDELLKVLSARNIIGDPIEMEDKIIIPITKMGMGFGTGKGWESKGNETINSKAGGGVGVIPVAIVVVFKGIPGEDAVKIVPLFASNPGNEPLTGIAAAAQTILEKIGASQDKKEKKEKKEKRSSKEIAVPVE